MENGEDGRFFKGSIRGKIFIGVLLVSIIPMLIVTCTSIRTLYVTMYGQIMQSRRASNEWLRDRLDLYVKKYNEQLYEFEVNKEFKRDIMAWCNGKEELDYVSRWRLISSLNTVISINPEIRTIHIRNLKNDETLIAKRSGAIMHRMQEGPHVWDKRDVSLQTNLVFKQNEGEILVMHQVNQFETNSPLAVISIHIRPSDIGEILENSKTDKNEIVLLFNDEDELIVSSPSKKELPSPEQMEITLDTLKNLPTGEMVRDKKFYFYESVNDKLQVVQIVPDNVIRKAIGQTLITGIVVAFLCLGISAFLAALFSKVVCKPIVDLSETMQKATLKDYKIQTKSNRQDEIGWLEDSFQAMMARNQELILSEYDSQIKKQEAQLRALQAQINPHFMYNALQTIGGMALEKDAMDVYLVAVALGDILRYSLNFSQEKVCLQEEIRCLNNYIYMQNKRFGNSIRMEVDIPDEWMGYLIPKLILQPIIENSIEHGFLDRSKDWKIRLFGKKTEHGDVLLSVTDNGNGMSIEDLQRIKEDIIRGTQKAMEASQNIGLSNVNARIRLTYGEDYGVSIYSEEGRGTEVRLLLKKENNNVI